MDASYITDRSVPEPNSGCRLWLLSCSRDGYGWAKRRRKTVQAHRLSYELNIGPVPDGMCVCHKCDVPSCVNPDHFWLGTNEQNTQDRKAKGRSARNCGEKAPSSKLNAAQAREIFYAEESQSAIGRRFGITRESVRDIKRGRNWAHLRLA